MIPDAHSQWERIQRGLQWRIGAGQARRTGILHQVREPLPKGLFRCGQPAGITIRIGDSGRTARAYSPGQGPGTQNPHRRSDLLQRNDLNQADQGLR